MSLRTLLTRLKPFDNLGTKNYTKFFSTTAAKYKNSDKSLQSVKEDQQGQIAVREIEEVHLVSGHPEEHIKSRKVCIYQPPKNAMQSGTDNINYWQIDFDTRERWENPLMGWSSTGDPQSNLQVEFRTMEEAVNHCRKMGYDYYIQKPNPVGPKPRSYGANFAWNKRTRVTTK